MTPTVFTVFTRASTLASKRLPCTKRIISEIPVPFYYSLHFDPALRKFLLDSLVDGVGMRVDPQ